MSVAHASVQVQLSNKHVNSGCMQQLAHNINVTAPVKGFDVQLRICAGQVVLRNGLRVFLVQDPDVPLVKGTLLFRGGLRASTPDKVGQGCFEHSMDKNFAHYPANNTPCR